MALKLFANNKELADGNLTLFVLKRPGRFYNCQCVAATVRDAIRCALSPPDSLNHSWMQTDSLHQTTLIVLADLLITGNQDEGKMVLLFATEWKSSQAWWNQALSQGCWFAKESSG